MPGLMPDRFPLMLLSLREIRENTVASPLVLHFPLNKYGTSLFYYIFLNPRIYWADCSGLLVLSK